MHTVDKRIQDRHSTVRDTSVGVDLLQHLVDVRGVGLLSGLGALLLFTAGSGGLLSSILDDEETRQKTVHRTQFWWGIGNKPSFRTWSCLREPFLRQRASSQRPWAASFF